MMGRGYEAYLAYVRGLQDKAIGVHDILTLREFPDVFLEELPSLPPDHEVKFDIE